MASARAIEALVGSKLPEKARIVALYAPIRDEADPTGLEAYLPNQTIAYPRTEIRDGHPILAFGVSRWIDLKPRGRWAIREPRATTIWTDPDLVIVPGLGFTPAGDRLGYGRGFYDKTLARIRTRNPSVVAVGFGFRVQLIDALPVEAHDERLDAIVTEDGLVAAARAG